MADFIVAGNKPHHIRDSFLNYLKDVLVWIHLRLLLQISYRIAGSPYYLTACGFLHSGDDLKDCGFSGAVQTDDTDLGSIEKAQVYVFEDSLIVVGKNLAYPIHREYYFFVCHIALCGLYKNKIIFVHQKALWCTKRLKNSNWYIRGPSGVPI